MMSRDLEEPWAEKVTATKEVPLKEPIGPEGQKTLR